MRRPSILFAALLLCAAPLRLEAAESRVGLGIFTLAPHGADLQLSVRPAGQRWAYGLRYFRWMDTFEDPFTGTPLTETTNTYVGVTLDYLFDPDARSTWYLSVAVYQATKQEHSLVTFETGEGSDTSPYFGGGFTGRMGERFYYDLGFLVAPGADLVASTSVSSEEDSGLFETRLLIGFRF